MKRFIPLLAFFLLTSGLAAKGGGNNGGGGSSGGGGSALTVTTWIWNCYTTQTTVYTGGEVSSSSGLKERGVCFSTHQNPTIADMKSVTTTPLSSQSGFFQAPLAGLSPGTHYYIRAYATKNSSTTYGNQLEFTTLEVPQISYNALTDADGNQYDIVKIGTQWWMMENLKTTKYDDGTPIVHVGATDADWVNPSIVSNGAYCEYNNSTSTADVYGMLYNWYAVTNPSHSLAPAGWHVATKADWDVLETYLGGIPDTDPWTSGGTGNAPGFDRDVAIPLKEAGTGYWNLGSARPRTNASSFTALPGGRRNSGNGGFADLGDVAVFWSSSSYPSGWPYNRSLHSNDDHAWIWPGGTTHPSPLLGASVRCVMDNSSKASSMGGAAPTSVPAEYALHQNYPNPFGRAALSRTQFTTIRYSLPEESVVRLRVFNTMGMIVAELENGAKPAGMHTVRFNAANLPSGTYFYRLDAAGMTKTRVMNIVK